MVVRNKPETGATLLQQFFKIKPVKIFHKKVLYWQYGKEKNRSQEFNKLKKGDSKKVEHEAVS